MDFDKHFNPSATECAWLDHDTCMPIWETGIWRWEKLHASYMPCQMGGWATVMPCQMPDAKGVHEMPASWCLHGDTLVWGIQASTQTRLFFHCLQNLNNPKFLFKYQPKVFPMATERVRNVGQPGLGIEPETRGTDINRWAKSRLVSILKNNMFFCLSLLN